MTNNKELYGSATQRMREMQDEHNHKESLKRIEQELKAKNRQQKPVSANNLKDEK
jgi:altronate dehydratase